MRAQRGLGDAGGAAAEEQNGGVIECQGDGWTRRVRVRRHQVVPRKVAGLEGDAVALFFLLDKRKEQAREGGQVFLDVGGDDAAHARRRLQ